MKTFIAFAFSKKQPDGTIESGFGRTFVEGIPLTNKALTELEETLKEIAHLDEAPTIIGMYLIPTPTKSALPQKDKPRIWRPGQ